MDKIFGKFSRIFTRRQRAKEWGIQFTRVESFELPKNLRLGSQNIEIKFPLSDEGMLAEFIEIFLDDCYKLKFWQKRLKPDAKILDIGGNVGFFALAARQAFPQAVIHSYEPNLSLEPYLKHQARVAKFNYYMKALGAKDGKVRLKLSQKNASANTVSVIDEQGDIPMLSLSNAVENLGETVDLAKIDCEGAEWDMLEARNVWDKIQNITLEYHLYRKGQTLDKIRQLVQSSGFKIGSIKPTNKYYGNLTASRIH